MKIASNTAPFFVLFNPNLSSIIIDFIFFANQALTNILSSKVVFMTLALFVFRSYFFHLSAGQFH